jgi:hypothetical protein
MYRASVERPAVAGAPGLIDALVVLTAVEMTAQLWHSEAQFLDSERPLRSLGSIRANIPTARGSLSSGPPTPSSLLLRRIGAPASPTAGPSRTRRAAGTSAISGWPFESHGGDLLLQPCPVWPPASLEVFVSVAKSPMAAYLARPGPERLRVSRPRHYPCRYGGECHGQDAHCHSCVAADTAPTDACGRQAACYRRESQCSRQGHGCD